MMSENRGGMIIFASFMLAYILSVLPMPEWLKWARPEWVALVLIYWVLAIPERIGVTTAWFVGLGADVLEGTMLGLNALSLSIVAYMVLQLYQRLRMFSPWQQCGLVLVNNFF